MNILQAHSILAGYPPEKRRELLPGAFDVSFFGGAWCDCWPACATAAIVLTGWLPNLREDEIPDALRQFTALYSAEIDGINDTVWQREAEAVVETLLHYGREVEAASGIN